MLLQFIKRDPAWKLAPWFAIAVGTAAFFYSTHHQSWLLTMLICPGYFGLYTRTLPHRRVTFFEASLPVSARQLFLARLLALLAVIWLPAMMAAVVMLFAGTDRIGEVVVVALMLTLSLLATMSVRIREFGTRPWVALAFLAVAFFVTVPLIEVHQPWLVAGASGICAVVAGLAVLSSVPAVFQSAPRDAARPKRKLGNASPSLPWWPVIRSLVPWQAAVFTPISLIWAATGDWIWAPMYLMMAYSQTRVTTRWTLALPISRQRMVAMSVVPLLVLLGGAAEVGMVAGIAQKPGDMIRQGDPDHFRAAGAIDVWVNRAFYQRAPGGRVPLIQAPWGETYQPEPFRILWLTFYNPYSVGQKNSLEFQDWQWDRAANRIFGKPVAARDLSKAAHAGLKPITEWPRMQILNLIAILGSALFWAWIVELFSWQGVSRLSKQVRTCLTAAILLVLFGLPLGLDFFVAGHGGGLTKSLLEGGLLRVSEWLPESNGLVAMLSILPLAALWWLLQRQAAAAEIPLQKVQPQSMFDRA